MLEEMLSFTTTSHDCESKTTAHSNKFAENFRTHMQMWTLALTFLLRVVVHLNKSRRKEANGLRNNSSEKQTVS